MTDNIEMHDLFEQRNLYVNPPVDVDEQIKILRNRGMIIDDYGYARDFLEEVYFHRFLSYSVPFFELNNLRRYQSNTHFSHIVNLYKFDSKLRTLVLDAIERIEISVRTQFINLSWKYGPHFYLKNKLFRDQKLLHESIEKIQFQINAGHDLLVSEYYQRYNEPNMPPIWIACELTTIGQLSKWIMNLKNPEDRLDVASRYQIPYRVLQAMLENFTLIRNYSAHHTRLYNRHFHFESELEELKPGLNSLLVNDPGIYNILILLVYTLDILKASVSFYQDLTKLLNHYQIPVELMGFPSNWTYNFSQLIHPQS